MRPLTKDDLDERTQAPNRVVTDLVDPDTGYPVVEIDEDEAKNMNEYSCSLPSGQITGKVWLRDLDAFNERTGFVTILMRNLKVGWPLNRKRLVMGEYGKEIEVDGTHGRKERHIEIHWYRVRIL